MSVGYILKKGNSWRDSPVSTDRNPNSADVRVIPLSELSYALNSD